jgi:hypothetical protein
MGSFSRPSADDELAFLDHEVNCGLKIGKRRAKIRRDLPLSFWAWKRISRPQVVTHVVGRKNVEDDIEIALAPHFVIESPDQFLPVLDCHMWITPFVED